MGVGAAAHVRAAVGSLQSEAVHDAHVPEHNSPRRLLRSLNVKLGTLEAELVGGILV